ncbi:MAG: S8 family serine peptidase, partial [Ignavibacteria bacterium]|nr:S8 family serine peptidase [Ignavibacteria bacterium]
MKTPTKFLLLFIFALSFSFIGWNNFSSLNTFDRITSFYYYKGQPFNLTLKNDRLFIKLNKELSEQSFRQMISSYGGLTLNTSSSYVPGDKRYFLDLIVSQSESGLLAIRNEIMKNPDIQYVSPVFSPDNGRTLIGVEDEIIVQFKPEITREEVNSFISQRNLTIIQEVSLSGGLTFVLKVPSYVFAIDAANEIYNTGKVNYSEPNLLFTNLLCYDPNDPFYPMQWSLKNLGNNIPGGISGTADCDMDVDSAWNTTLGISQCRIAISDTGVDTLHEDLAGNMVIGSGWNFWNNTPGAWDDGNHGTACAGIAAAIGNNSLGVSGVAPNCKIIPVKWLSSGGSGNYTGASNATIWAYQRGAWVISNSWGFVGGASSMLDNAISDAVTFGRAGKGSLFVVASGNENGAMRFPASTNPNVIAVGGISPCNQRKSPSSCDLESWGASFGANLDVVAPCVKVYTTDRTGSPGYSSGNYFATFNGTSSATPNVAGVCALALSVDSTMRWDTVRVRLARTC